MRMTFVSSSIQTMGMSAQCFKTLEIQVCGSIVLLPPAMTMVAGLKLRSRLDRGRIGAFKLHQVHVLEAAEDPFQALAQERLQANEQHPMFFHAASVARRGGCENRSTGSKEDEKRAMPWPGPKYRLAAADLGRG